ncbi:MAG: DUF2520 domain-containing protein [Myxococcales bacterium]|nr:DUF2520 domain-containing protein [Myxococcales bacterium]
MAPSAPRLRILGAGRVGSALAALLEEAGCEIVDLWTRSAARAAASSAAIGRPCRSGALDDDAEPAASLAADATIIAVRDDVVAEVCRAGARLLERAPVVLHVSGATPAARALAEAPAELARGTLHPLAAVSTLAQARRVLGEVYFGVEGDEPARQLARALVSRLGAHALELEAEQMVRYHAAAVTASNLAVALWGEAAALLESAGVSDGLAALLPLIRSTVDNVATLGPIGALTGPVRRGDRGTVSRHLESLAQQFPRILPLYRAASLAALELARASADPPDVEDIASLQELLKPAADGAA